MRRIVRFIPDFITSLNLLCGVAGIVFAFRGRFDIAFPLMLAAAVFDFMDGLAARLLDAYSPLGKELDSLSDVVSFGVLPAVMLHCLMRACTFSDSWIVWVPLVLAVFSGLRLAKFNLDERQKESFLGLPTPACAMLCGAFCYYVAFTPGSVLAAWAGGLVFIPVMSVLLSALLVCEIPMFSFKFGCGKADGTVRWKRLALLLLVALSVVAVVLLRLNWSAVVLLTLTLYILKNIVYWVFKV